MHIFVRLCPLLIICSVLGFHKGFLKFLFGGFAFVNFVACLKGLALDFELGCRFFLFGWFKQVFKFLGLLLLFGFGVKFFYSDTFSRVLVRFICDLRGKSGELRNGFSSNNVLDGKFWPLKFLKEDSYVPLIDKMEEKKEKPNPYTDSDEKMTSDEEYDSENNEDDGKEYTEKDGEVDVSKLRKLIKIERHRANAARAELAEERASSATAAEEAMAMILRLQNEKSLIEMELSQYRRLAEEKQIHDQEVIQSLQWLVCEHKSDRRLLEEQLKVCRQKLKLFTTSDVRDDYEEVEEAQSCFIGNMGDALENVLYSSRDANLSP